MTSVQFIRLVAVREVRERIRSRSFIVSNVILVGVILVAMILVPILAQDDPYRLGMVGDQPDGTEATITAIAEDLDREVEFRAIASREAAVAAVEADDIDAFLVGTEELVFEEEQSDRLTFIVNTATAAARTDAAIRESGISADQIATLASADAPIAVSSITEPEEENFITGTGGAVVGVVLMFMAITMYGNTVLMGVLEEKTTRVVEVILSTVRPWQLLAGKVLGLGFLGLAQLAAMVGVGLGVAAATGATEIPEGAFANIGWVLVWFVLGFTFYAVLYAMGGAMAGKIEDAQSTAAPAGIMVLVGYLASFAVVLPNPEGLAAKVLSVIPLFAPFAMPALITVGEAEPWQIVGSVVIMLVAITAAIRLAGRIYAGGVLGGGERLKLGQAWQAADDINS